MKTQDRIVYEDDSLLKGMRKKMQEHFLKNTNNIDKLLTEKVEDYILLEETPLPIQVGKKVIFIGNFNFENQNRFFQQWALILSNLTAKIMNMEIADERRKDLIKRADFELLANGEYMYEFLRMDTWLFKQLIKLLGNTLFKQQAYIMIDNEHRVVKKWKNCSVRYFKKHISMEKLIQICFMVYTFNFDGQKKSLQVIMDRMVTKELQAMYIPYWLQNLDGITGLSQPVPSQNMLSFYNELKNNEIIKRKEGNKNGKQ